MANEGNKFSQGTAGQGSQTAPQHNKGQGTGTASAPRKDSFTDASGAFDKNNETAKGLLDQAKEKAGQAYDSVAEKASTKLEEQKGSLSGGLSSVATSVRKVGANLKDSESEGGLAKYTAEYSDVAAQKIEQVADYLERKDMKGMYRDVENFARSNPAIFIGGAFAIGLLAARFLKSSNPRQLSKAAGQSFGSAPSSDSDYSNGKAKSTPNQSSF
jgi:ElaB/YqjD/DUF883 family membrane-anchored ribosome-binding protein